MSTDPKNYGASFLRSSGRGGACGRFVALCPRRGGPGGEAFMSGWTIGDVRAFTIDTVGDLGWTFATVKAAKESA